MQKISSLREYLALDPSQLANTILYCQECGKEHKIPIKIACSGENLISKLPEIVATILGKSTPKIGIIYDRHIEGKLEKLFFLPFNKLGFSFVKCPLGDVGVLIDSSVDIGDKAVTELPKGINLLIGVGSGVICDLTKWIATKVKSPFIIMGTAASMNAYTSISATMTENNIKSSIILDPASAVLLDSDLMASAPHEMTCAGIGDLLARNVCNADWMLSKLLRETYFCPVPFQMMISCQDKYLSQIDLIAKNDIGAMKSLSDALLLSGYSMAILDGETSSSSGSEHIISHFFDFQHELYDLPKNLHGTQVGIGTIIMSTAYDILRRMDPTDFQLDDIETHRLSLTTIHNDHKQLFGKYGELFDSVVAKKRIPDNKYRSYLEKIFEKWDEIWELLDPFLMPTAIIRQALEEIGAITKISGIQRTKPNAIQALLYGSHYRQRYTILDLFWELGLFPALAPKILEEAKVLEQT
jgi:glycerol-1-phosphate dehydrogenase [NAD(P)+]